MDLNTIKERKRECIKKFGIDYDYVPSKNKKNVKFILKDCKKIQKTSKRDAYTRYYVDVHDNKTERERTLESIIDQYTTFVKPSYEQWVLPTKKYANIIIPNAEYNHVAIDMLIQHIIRLL